MNVELQRQLLAFTRNTVLRASAGTGKTEALTQLCLHLMGGGCGEAVPPTRIVALTFTELAASEMRQRIQAAWHWLCEAPDPLPPAEAAPRSVQALLRHWQEQGTAPRRSQRLAVQRQLMQARIGTLHGFCASLLRQAAATHGLDPHFRVLPAPHADRLLEEAVLAGLLARLDAADPEVQAMHADLRGLHGSQSLVPQLSALYRQWAEKRREDTTTWQAQAWPADDATRARQQALTHLALTDAWPAQGQPTRIQLAHAWGALLTAHQALAARPEAKRSPSFRQAAACADALAKAEPPLHPAALLAAADALQRACGSGGASEDAAARQAREAVRTLLLLPAWQTRSEAVARLLLDIDTRYLDAKRREGGLDFADLLRGACDLLRHHPALRRQLTLGIDALLVDEFQDTNALQRDLLQLLHAHPEQGEEPPSAATMRPSGLFLVGDRKQSIYAFRGADVSVFEQTAAEVLAQGGQELALQDNHRSIEPLLAGLAHLAAQAFRSEAAPDPLRAVRQAPTPDAAIETLAPAAGLPPHAAEAAAIAHRLQRIVQEGRVQVEEQGAWRPARYGDIAILLPRLTRLEPLLQALQKAGVPHSVLQGRGLLRSLQAEDVLAMAQLFAGPSAGQADGLSLAAVLHSPWVGLSTEALLALRQLPHAPAWHAPLAAWLRSLQGQPLQACFETLARLQNLLPSLGLPRTLALAYQQLGYDDDPQGVANLERLLDDLQGLDDDPSTAAPASALRAMQRRHLRGDAMASADLLPEDADQVRILTIHQAKGLQFPIVVAADLGRPPRREALPLQLDDALHLSAAVRDSQQRWQHPPWTDAELAEERQASERMRLFYVQITRARDRLLLVQSAKPHAQSLWTQVVEPCLPALLQQGLLQAVDAPPSAPDAAEPPPPPAKPSPTAGLGSDAPVPPPPTFELSVSQLHEWSLCPRRFRSRYELALPEGEQSAARRGSLLHAVLERLDWPLACTMPGKAWQLALEGTLAQPAWAVADAAYDAAARQELLALVLPMLSGGYAQQLAATPAVHLQRELPFLLHLPGDACRLALHGTLDLLRRTDDGLELVDYKTTSPAGADPIAPYRLQLHTYALALRRQDAHARIRVGVQFLDGRSALPHFEAFDAEAEHAATKRLKQLLGELHDSHQHGLYAGRPKADCQRLRCALLPACHLMANTANAPAKSAPATT